MTNRADRRRLKRMQQAQQKQPVMPPQPRQPGHIVATEYQGNVPPPGMLEAFNRINPKYSDDLFAMALAASARQDKLVDNQRAQIDNERELRDKEIASNERLKTLEIKGINRDAMMKNIVALVGAMSASAVCIALLYFSYILLTTDRTGAALGMASPVLGCALVAAIKILRK